MGCIFDRWRSGADQGRDAIKRAWSLGGVSHALFSSRLERARLDSGICCALRSWWRPADGRATDLEGANICRNTFLKLAKV
jgi:hypothetical protein